MKSIFCAIGFASIASAAAVHAEAAVHARDVVNARDVANAQKAAVTFTSTDVVSTTQGCKSVRRIWVQSMSLTECKATMLLRPPLPAFSAMSLELSPNRA